MNEMLSFMSCSDPLFKTGNSFSEELMQAMKEPIAQELASIQPERSRAQIPYLVEFLLYGTVGIIQAWIHGGRKEPSSEIARYIYTFCRNAVSEPIGQNRSNWARGDSIWK